MVGYIFGGNTGISGPEELARRRKASEALIQSGTEGHSKNIWEGLGSIAKALSGSIAYNRIAEREKEGRASGRAAFQPIVDALKSGKPVNNPTLVNAMSNDWLNDAERNVLGTFFKQNFEAKAPNFEVDRQPPEPAAQRSPTGSSQRIRIDHNGRKIQ